MALTDLTQQAGRIEAAAQAEADFRGAMAVRLAGDIDRVIDPIERLITAVGALGSRLTPNYRGNLFVLSNGTNNDWQFPADGGQWAVDSVVAWTRSDAVGTALVTVSGLFASVPLAFRLTAGNTLALPLWVPTDAPFINVATSGLTAGAACVFVRMARYG